MKPSRIYVFTDGGCRPTPKGVSTGIGVVCIEKGKEEPVAVLSQAMGTGTNNTAELQAAIEGILLGVHLGYKEIHIISDSNYVVQSMNEWYSNWVKKGKLVGRINEHLFRKLWEEAKRSDGVNVVFKKIKGHSGNRYNDQADALATEAIVGERRLQRVLGPRVNNFK